MTQYVYMPAHIESIEQTEMINGVQTLMQTAVIGRPRFTFKTPH